MGSTLEHGIYLPSEGEKNCYQGLASNWNKVDGALGDIAELKQSIESKFTKEIVTELPTEDINPFCIYMILKTDPETDNVYDEWVYINNAWEYLGNTKVDMTQYYTKQEVNQLPAVASGVTATKVGNYDAHIANGDIHVTASDKTKWTNSANTHVLRLALSALTPSTSDNSFSNLDDATALKVGDKVMDTAGVLFEVTAIDTANSTFTIGTALIDLAQDSDVVHKSGNETVSGTKTFSSDITLQGTTTPVIKTISNIIQDSTGGNDSISWVIRDKTDSNTVFAQSVNKFSGQSVDWRLDVTSILNGTSLTRGTRLVVDPANGSYRFTSSGNNTLDLGSSTNKWKGVYAINYYYGNNNVEFSTKFVTTDTAQTISGTKTFTDNNMIKTSSPKVLLINTSQTGNTPPSSNTASFFRFDGGTVNNFGGVQCEFLTTGENRLTNYVNDITKAKVNTIQQRANSTTAMTVFNADLLAPATDGVTALGSSSKRWSDVQTYKVNGVEPSSLSLPDLSNAVDISGYITDLTGSPNVYSPPANGYIVLRSTTANVLGIVENTTGMGSYSRGSNQVLAVNLPVVKNSSISIYAICSSLTQAKFIPCQGNV